VEPAGPSDNLTSERRVAIAATLGRRLVAGIVDGALVFGLLPVVNRF
jgi:hypothetical protein